MHDGLEDAGLGAQGDVDADDDGLWDGSELLRGTDAFVADTDGDGVSDGDEVNLWGSDALIRDSDFDGVFDGVEVGLAGRAPRCW